MGDDFDVFQSLWTNIQAATVPETLPGHPPKAVFMMEMPGFSIDPNSFYLPDASDDKGWDYSKMEMHPDRAVAQLADRVPALAPYFYDTGSHISFYWKQLLETYQLSWTPENVPELKAKYEKAIKMLYGDEEGYIRQRKTELFQQLEPLRKKWQDAMKDKQDFCEECKKKNDNGEYFQSNAGPYVEKIAQAYTEYENLKSQIEQYEAAIFQYTRGDLSRLLLKQAQGMALYANIAKFQLATINYNMT